MWHPYSTLESGAMRLSAGASVHSFLGFGVIVGLKGHRP